MSGLVGQTGVRSGIVGSPTGHVINWANGTNTYTSELTVSTSGTDHTALKAILKTTSTSNKMVVDVFLPGVYNNGANYRALHVGFRYDTGGGATQLGSRSFITSFVGYENPANALIISCHVMLSCAVPAVGTLEIFPRLQANSGDVVVYANAGGTSGGGSYIYDEASIVAYEVKQ